MKKLETIIRDLNMYSVDFIFRDTVDGVKVKYCVSWDDGDDTQHDYSTLAFVEDLGVVADTAEACNLLHPDVASRDNLLELGWTYTEIKQGYLEKWRPYIFPRYDERNDYLIKNYSDLVVAVGERVNGEKSTAEEVLDECEYELALWLWLKVREIKDGQVNARYRWWGSLEHWYASEFGDLIEKYLM